MEAFIGALQERSLRLAQQFLSNFAKLRGQILFGITKRRDLFFKAALALLQARFKPRQAVLGAITLDNHLIKHRAQLARRFKPCFARTATGEPTKRQPT